ncbi:MAG: hypothetical protein C0404_08385 [Verrucomicrobia bacterium]|nr:hypothetical protein [Verrucomicrobiota bacterium]
MAQAVIMPKLGQATEESTIVKWHKKEGDTVKKGDILFEMETDKAVLEAESFFDGTLLKIFVPEKVTVPVNVVVAYIGTPGEKVPDAPPPPPPQAAAPAKQEAAAPQAAAAPSAAAAPAAAGPAPARHQTQAKPAPAAPTRLFISPRARALAKASVIDPAAVRGTGPNGRITEADVRAYLQANKYDQLKISPAAKKLAAKEGLDVLRIKGTGDAGRIMVHDVERAAAEKPRTMSKMRQVIARRLTDSFTGTPHFYATVSVDMTNLLAFRKELKDAGKPLGVTAFILEAVILALKEFPAVNSMTTDGVTIRWRGAVDLGMAVGLEEGLVVPVIRSAEDLSMKELHETADALSARARAGKLLPDEMTGGSFTVSNMGMLDVECFNAIINPGEGAILAVASTIPTVVVRDGKMVIRSIMKITASVDHRIIDGTTAAAFVNSIKRKLEDVELWKTLT